MQGVRQFDRFFLDVFVPKLNMEKMESTTYILNQMDAGEEAIEWFTKFSHDINEATKRKPKPKKGQPIQPATVAIVNEWTPEEITALTKGMIKFPAGVPNRWGQIQKMIGDKKKLNDIMTMVNELKCQNIKGPQNITSQIEKVLDQNYERKDRKASGEMKSPKKPEVIAEKVDGPADEWSQEQQKLLEKALKIYPASIEAQSRWAQIAEMVGGGKSKKDCLARVKEIKANMGKKK